MVLNATFNNISVVSWRSILLGEQTGENYRNVSHNIVLSKHRLSGIRTHNVSGDMH